MPVTVPELPVTGAFEKLCSMTAVAGDAMGTEDTLSLIPLGTFSGDESVPPLSTIDGHAVAADGAELSRSLRALIANNLRIQRIF